MNWANAITTAALLLLAVSTLPYGLVLLIPLAFLWWR